MQMCQDNRSDPEEYILTDETLAISGFPLLTAMLVDQVYRGNWFREATRIIKDLDASQREVSQIAPHDAGAVLSCYRAAFSAIEQITEFHNRRIKNG